MLGGSKELCPKVYGRVSALADGFLYGCELGDHIERCIIICKSILYRAPQLLDIVCVELENSTDQFSLTYVFLSVQKRSRHFIRLVSGLYEALSLQAFFKSACWLEREVWDMFGVVFKGAADLRRLLTDYGFQGHPLRKSFPLSGFVELRYDDVRKTIAYEPVRFTQDYRIFDFVSPWPFAK